MKNFILFKFLIGLFLTLALTTVALADNNEISGAINSGLVRYDVGEGNSVLLTMNIKAKLWTLMGEPVDMCVATWDLQSVTLKNGKSYTAMSVPSKVWKKIDIVDANILLETNAYYKQWGSENNNFAYYTCNPGVFNESGSKKPSMNTPGSGKWGEFFKQGQIVGDVDKDRWIDEATLKGWFKDKSLNYTGRMKFSKLQINLWPLKEWVESQEKEKKEKEEEAKKAKEPKSTALDELDKVTKRSASSNVNVWDEMDDKVAEPEIRQKLSQLQYEYRQKQYPLCEKKFAVVQQCMANATCNAPKLPDGITESICKNIPQSPWPPVRPLTMVSSSCDKACIDDMHRRQDLEYKERRKAYETALSEWKLQYGDLQKKCLPYLNSDKAIKQCVEEYNTKCNPTGMSVESCVDDQLKYHGPTVEDAKKLVHEGWKKKSTQPKPSTSQPTNFLD